MGEFKVNIYFVQINLVTEGYQGGCKLGSLYACNLCHSEDGALVGQVLSNTGVSSSIK